MYEQNNHIHSAEHRKFAAIILSVISILGNDHFRIHPKGTGVICTNKGGIRPDVFVSEYLGEIYPPYRWCEKLDVLRKTQAIYGLKPVLPDFYNILLEKHRSNSDGYGMLFVDASQFANMGSSCSHSCNPNCTSAVVVRNGRNVIALTTNRAIEYGEELTMDYYSVTSSEDEWKSAICLCGMRNCRGSFLHYSTRDDLQQVLNRFCSPVYRFASLANASTDVPIDAASLESFQEYGILDNALGKNSPKWIQKFAYDNLKFIEYERRSLPSALLRTSLEKNEELNNSALISADADAHSVMESRIQAVVISFSIVRHLLDRQPDEFKNKPPIRRYSENEACKMVFWAMKNIPDLLFEYLVAPAVSSDQKSDSSFKPASAKKNDKSVTRVINAVKDIRIMMMKDNFCTISNTSRTILNIRRVVESISEAATPHARLQQLSDVLVLWAHTANFLAVEEYCEVQCDPIKVCARELGNNVPRTKLLQHKYDKKTNLHNGVRSGNSKKKKGGVKSITNGADVAWHRDLSSQSDIAVSFHKYPQVDFPRIEDVADCASETPNMIYPADHIVSCGDLETLPVAPIKSLSEFLEPNEVVYDGSVTYNSLYIFWQVCNYRYLFHIAVLMFVLNRFLQLMGWFNAGTDDLIESPDVMGTLQLPLPCQCFGPAESNYGAHDRKAFLNHILDEFKQSAPWPTSIIKTFSAIPAGVPIQLTCLIGSPFLDTVLGVGQVTKKLSAFFEMSVIGESIVSSEMQYDNMLPPESSHCSWICCTKCRKWRRVAWYVDPALLPELWECDMNTWDLEKASCEALGDYDPSVSYSI